MIERIFDYDLTEKFLYLSATLKLRNFPWKQLIFFLKHPISNISVKQQSIIFSLRNTLIDEFSVKTTNFLFSCKRCKPNFSNFQWKQWTYIQMVPMDKIKAWSVITQLVHVNHSCVSFSCVKCGILTNFPSLFSWIFFCTSQNW